MTNLKADAETDAVAPGDTSLVSGVSSCSKSSTPLLHSDEMREALKAAREFIAELVTEDDPFLSHIDRALSTPHSPWRDNTLTLSQVATAVEIVKILANTPPADWLLRSEIHANLAEFRLPTPPALIGDGDQK